MDADGGNARLVTAVSDPSYLTVAPDGRTVFFASTRDGTLSTWRVPIDGGIPTLVTPLFDRPAVSPDGRFLAGIYRADTQSAFALAVVSVEGGKPVKVFAALISTSTVNLTGPGGVVQWTADGEGVLFTTTERMNVWLQRVSGGDPVRITNFSEQTLFRAEPSPDGKTLIAARGNQTRDAFLISNFR